MPTTVYEDLNEYRLAWVDTKTGKPGKGSFLFDRPIDAETTIEAVRKQFPNYLIWLEDRECNKIEV